MRTISGQCVSSKEISLSKAAKILNKFVSADNGASHVISAYLHRASASFNEMHQLHKELKSSHSHKKHKRHRVESGDECGRVVENGYENDEKSTQTVVKLSQELNGSIGDQMGNVGGIEKHRKNKKKKQEVESGQEQGDVGDDNTGTEERKKQKREKKKHKEGTCNSSSNKGEVENLEGKNAKGQQLEEIEKKLCNGVEGENGEPVGSRDLQIGKNKNCEAGSENKLYAEEVKMEQRKKRKSEGVGERPEERFGDQTKKRMKRKHEGDL